MSLNFSEKSRKSGKRKSGNSRMEARKGGRPKIPMEEGCTINQAFSGMKHCYTMFGNPKESCVKCGKEHSLITEWRRKITEGEYEDHPYVKLGYWSHAEYKKAMKQK